MMVGENEMYFHVNEESKRFCIILMGKGWSGRKQMRSAQEE